MNCNAKVAKHIIRMASTRAKARCLRDMTNIGMTCLEELGDIAEAIGAEDEMGKTTAGKKDNVRKFTPKQTGHQAQPVQKKPVDQGKVESAVNPEAQASPSQENKPVKPADQPTNPTETSPVNQDQPQVTAEKAPVRETRVASARPAAKSGNWQGQDPHDVRGPEKRHLQPCP